MCKPHFPPTHKQTHRYVPVSYTHLDVDKRQVIWTAAKNSSKKMFNTLQDNTNATLSTLVEWSDNNNMKSNCQKTHHQLFSLKTKTKEICLKIENNELQRSDNTTYLGVVLDNKLTLKQHSDKICAKVSPKTSVLKKLAEVKFGGTLDLLNETYKIYIKPNIMYLSLIHI